ncbi:MAG: tetratricopeptide repeat protein, partial [Thiohalobacteraceae bacterium]
MGGNPVDALIAQAEMLRTAGRLQESERALRAALQVDSKNFAAWQGLSRLAQQVGRVDEAVHCLSRAYAINPTSGLEAKLDKLARKFGDRERARLYREIALLQVDLGNIPAGIGSIRKSLRADPQDAEAWFYFSRFLQDVRFTSRVGPALRADLANALASGSSDKQYMAHAVISALMQEHGFKDLCQRMLQAGSELDIGTIDLAVLNDRLSIGLLRGALMTDRRMELLLTALRRHLLGKTVESLRAGARVCIGCDEFLVALAAQCSANEYIFSVTDQEASSLKALTDQIAGQTAEAVPGVWLAILGAYMPLIRLRNAAELSQRCWPEPWDSLIGLQVRDLMEEDAIKATLGAISEIRAGVSASVREQYEENPFPRWLSLPMLPREHSVQAYLGRLFPAAAVAGSASND